MKYCGKCGCEINPETGLCPKCDQQKSNKNRTSKKILLIPIAILLICMIIGSILLATGVINFPWKEKISEENAEKMINLVEEIKKLEENNASKSEIKDYLNTLDWMKIVSESDDGGLTCVTEFGVTAAWTPEKENVIGNSKPDLNPADISNSANTDKKDYFVRSIALLCPYASEDSDFLLDEYSFLGDTMTKYANSSFTVFKDNEVTLDLLKHLDQYDMVWFYSHGALSNVFDSAWAIVDSDPYTMTGEFADSKAKYISLSEDFFAGRTIISLSSGRIGVGGNFYEHYYSDKALRNTFFHFASCNSLRTEKLADGLLSRGAIWVEGWSDSVNFSNDYGHFMFVIESLLNHNTIQQSVINADKKVREDYPKIYQDDCKLKGKGNGDYKLESKNQSDISIEEELEKAFSGTLSGKVISSKDNKALADVTITVYKSNDSNKEEVANSFTDKDGSFEISLSAGEYDFEFTKKGYKSHTTGAKLEKGVITVLKDEIVLEPQTVDFVNNKYLVKCDDVIYGVDQHGLWKNEGGYNKDYLAECSATNLATDGQVIYYSVLNKKTSNNSYQYDLYQYDIETGSNRKITSFNECGKPICEVDNTIYYADYSEEVANNPQLQVGQGQSLWAYSKSTGKSTHICDGANIVMSYNGKIFDRDLMAAVPTSDTHQIYCYDTSTNETKKISDGGVMSFKIESGKLLYDTFKYDTGNNRTCKVCSYDISSGKTNVLFEKTNDSVEVEDYDEKYVIYSETRMDGSGLIRFEVQSEKEDLLPPSKFNGKVPSKAMRDSDRTIFYTDYNGGIIYTMEDSGTNLESTISSYKWQMMLMLKNDTVFAVTNDSKNFYEYYISCGRAS